MGTATHSFELFGSGDTARGAVGLPPQVEQLPSRERQVASIVYRAGYATAKEVQFDLPEPLSNGAVRSMLLRLVRKGILTRRRGGPGAGCYDVYIAALSVDVARKRALDKLADEFFGGSLVELKTYLMGVAVIASRN